MLTIEKIIHAQRVLEEAIYKTDVIRTSGLSDECELFLKAENLQKTGSFKIRGAYYKISQLSAEEKKRGVIACSAGNHAQGVALAAQKNGIPALICLPEGAPISKVEATRSYGAELCLVPGVYDDAYNRALQLQKERSLTFIHPFDDEDVIAGQGTIGLEILAQVKDIDAIVVPVGGGGLISGVAFAVKQMNPKVQVYGVQASGAASMATSLHDGKIECLPSVSTIADGIAVKQPGEHTFDYCNRFVDGIVTVTDEEISAAIIDVTILSRVITRGLVMSGRQCTLNIELLDKPGQLVAVSQIIAKCGANVVGVHHEHANAGSEVIGCYLRIDMETRNFEHIQEIRRALSEAGFKICD